MYKKDYSSLGLFLTTLLILILLGCIFIYSSSAVFALEQVGSGTYYLKKQLMGLGLGILGIVFLQCIPLPLIKKSIPLLFLAALSLTALTLLPGMGTIIHGSRRWIFLGPFSLQPSEFLKHAFILYLANFLTKREFTLNSFIRSYLPCLIVTGITSIILLKQPDFGMAMTLCLTAGLMMFIAQMPLRFLLATIASGLPIIGFLIFMSAYRLNRITSFLNPWDDPQGKGFQIIQSLIAIGSGGFFGRGIGSSKQKFFYLPMQHTDFIFSIIAEETGFLGSVTLTCLFILFLYSGLKLAWSLTDRFSTLATLGFTLLISLQAIMNLMVTAGLMPTKGVGLPFISYGNSSLLSNLLMVGLIINFVRNNKRS